MSDQVIFEILKGHSGHIGHITLNNPKALNALNVEMIIAFQKALDACENDPQIKVVFIEGSGEKAFCAGGDVVGLYHSMKATEAAEIPKGAADFFTQEYQLDYRLHTFKKPIISWGDGIVMGGGIGLAAACSHRIVTEKSMYAMPEVTIGLYPDVGASWFFNRMPNNIGLFLGLTGARINASDAIFAKLADDFLLNEDKSDLLKALSQLEWKKPHEDVNRIIQSISSERNEQRPVNNLRNNYDEINALLRGDNLTAVVAKMLNAQPENQWMKYAKKGFIKGCPTTYCLVFEQIKRAKHMSLKDVFKMELIMSTRCAMNGDLQEGIRALLIDKDGSPQWTYNAVESIEESFINNFFMAPWNENHPLADL